MLKYRSNGTGCQEFAHHYAAILTDSEGCRQLEDFPDCPEHRSLTLIMSLSLSRALSCGSSSIRVLKSSNGPTIYVSKCGIYGRGRIGKREVVGFGLNGSYTYADRMDFPYPAIRFKEIKDQLIPIQEKEKGDWKKLTIDEKKARE